MPAADTTNSVTHSDFALPLVIAVTGHRDLRTDEIPGIRDRVRELMQSLAKEFPDRRLFVMSALAEGADRVVAEIAIDLGIDLTVVLPMPKTMYIQDFETADSRSNFESLCNQAKDFFELPPASGSTLESIAHAGHDRDRQYAQLGVFLCAHCHVLLALWDGKHGNKLGGTGQVVKFHHDDIMPGFSQKSIASQQMLVDDESDLVYHVVCSRDRPDGAPYKDFIALDCAWYTKDRLHPRSTELPAQHRMIFQRSGEFSHDALSFARRIEDEKYTLVEPGQAGKLPEGISEIDRLFGIADWLAIHYQRKTFFALRITHILAFLMGLMFLLYSDLENQPFLMYAFLIFFLLAAALQFRAKQRGWHRRYLDYRTLAEGLRVQFYWAAAGVSNENESKFAHDNFLQTQDPELGWIRNVMRVAGTRCDATRQTSATGLDFTIREWIGDDDNGQLSYYRKKALERIRKNRATERLGTLSLVTSVAIVITFVVAGAIIPEQMTDPLMIVMGTLLLLFGVRHGYAYSTAEKELINQYEFMLRIFLNARRRLDKAEDVSEQRQVLLALGGSALDEHAQWILMHRDRSIDQGEIWRMGS